MARNSLKSVMRLIQSAKEELPVEQEFLSELKRSVELDDKKNSRKPSQSYKPSSMNCLRNMYYQVMGKDTDPGTASYTGIAICNAGSDIHVRVQTAIDGMKENGMDCEYINVAEFVKNRNLEDIEVRGQSGVETKLFNKKLNMSFMCDGIIKYKNRYYILEIKSETINKWYVRKDVDVAHHNQATAYSISLGLNDVLFVYVNRDMLDMKSFMFHVTDEMKHDLVGRIEECDGYVKRMVAPPKPEDVAKKTCEYCPYKKQCREDG